MLYVCMLSVYDYMICIIYESDMYMFGVGFVMMEEMCMAIFTAKMPARLQNYMYGSLVAII